MNITIFGYIANGMDRFIVTFLGRQGSGKTYLIRECLPKMPRPVFVLDTMGEFSEGLQFYTTEQLAAYLSKREQHPSGLYVLNATSDVDCEAWFELFVTLGEAGARHGQKAEAVLIIDEASKFCDPRKINPNLKRIINYGRHWGQHLVFAARRSVEVHRDVTAQSGAIISFKQTESRDVKRLARSYPAAKQLPELDAEEHEYMCFGDWQRLPFAGVLSPANKTKKSSRKLDSYPTVTYLASTLTPPATPDPARTALT